MLLTTMTSLDLQRRLLPAVWAPGQRTGLGCSWLKCSEKDAISRCGFTRCMWNVHLHLDVSCAVLLLALRCNSKNRRRNAVSQKMALKNVDPDYRGGLRGLRTKGRNPELNLRPMLSQAEAEAVDRSQPSGGLWWGGVS